jgi:hypothetical protein
VDVVIIGLVVDVVATAVTVAMRALSLLGV